MMLKNFQEFSPIIRKFLPVLFFVLPSAFTGALLQPNAAQAGGGYAQSCTYTRFYKADDPVLYAHCLRKDGTTNFQSRIDLNGVIANLDGRFAWQTNGGFNGSCFNKHIVDGHILEANCFRLGHKDPQPAGIDLNQRILNDNGDLRYGGE